MNLQYMKFCQAGSRFYDLPQVPAEAGFLAPDAELPEGWQRRTNADWDFLCPDGAVLRPQGWKIHVSADLGNARRILDTAFDYCVRNAVPFKFIRSTSVLTWRNSKYGDRGSSGKFITVYPADDGQFATVLDELGALMDGEPGPYILSDLRWRSGPLYVRYGAFVEQVARSAETGEAVYCITDPQGALVPDRRGPGFRPPAWAVLPDCLAEALRARNSGTLEGFPFAVSKALHFSNGGGVYLATDRRDGGTVLLKEARPMAGLDESGADAVSRLEREHWALRQLSGLPAVPELVDYRVGREHFFLARAFVDGVPLIQEMLTRNPLVTGERSDERYAEYTSWALKILEQIDEGVHAMHGRGVVFGDLHPNNVLVRADGSIAFIDLETASETDADAGQSIGAPGFRAPLGYTGTAVDRYALGCLRLALFLPLTVALPWDRAKAEQFLAVIAERFPVPGDFAESVYRDLGPNAWPATAPAPAPTGDAAPWWDSRPEAWDRLRDAVGAGIAAAATPDRQDRLFPGDIEQFAAPGGGVTFAHGAAGVLWALAESGCPVPADQVDWLAEAAERLEQPRPGFYDGLSGLAFALDRLGRPEQAAGLLRRALALPIEDAGGSLLSGTAGIALAALHFGVRTGDPELCRAAGRLAERATADGRRAGRPGLLHGRTGDALLLLRLHERNGDPALLAAAETALRQDLTALGWGAAQGSPQGPPPGDAPWQAPYLTAGGGVALVLRQLLDRLADPDPELVAAADRIREAAGREFTMNAGLFHGRAGTVLTLRQFTDGSSTPALERHIRAFGWHAVPVDGHLDLLGDHALRFSADLATGAAGVLLAVAAARTPAGRTGLPFLCPDRPFSAAESAA